MKKYYIYIMSSESRVLYVGVTNNLRRRVIEHQEGIVEGFSQKYKIKKLIYFEEYTNVNEAITREKQLKNWRREKKVFIIEQLNKEWKDLSKEFGF